MLDKFFLDQDTQVSYETTLLTPGEIKGNPYQPRSTIEEEQLTELAESIKEVGILSPPVVRKEGDGSYVLIIGQRRIAAMIKVGFQKIPVLVKKEGPLFSAYASLIENIQRVDLNPIEIAEAMKRLIDEFGLTQEDLASSLGKKRSTVANFLRLLHLPNEVRDALRKERLSFGHAKVLLSLDDQQSVLYFAKMTLSQTLSVRELEALIRKSKYKRGLESAPKKDVHLSFLEAAFREKLGTEVKIRNHKGRGKIEIDFYSLDDLDQILALFGVDHG